MSIDSLNWKILNCLQENARLSNAEIGRRVGVSSPAVSERIKKMEDLGIIQSYNTTISSFQAGYQLKALITLRAFMGKLKPFLEKVTTPTNPPAILVGLKAPCQMAEKASGIFV